MRIKNSHLYAGIQLGHFTDHISFHSQNDSRMRQCYILFVTEKEKGSGRRANLLYFTAQEDIQSLSWKVKSDGQAPGALASFYFCSISSNPKLIGDTQGRCHCTGHKPQEFQALRTQQGGFPQKILGWASPKESGFTSRNKQLFSGLSSRPWIPSIAENESFLSWSGDTVSCSHQAPLSLGGIPWQHPLFVLWT